MRRQRLNSIRRASAGFTLFEMIIVVSVILLIAGLVWPVMMRFYQESTLIDSGRIVRDTLSATRLAAIDMGVPYHFLYEPEKGRFLMIPAGGVEQNQTNGIQGSDTFPTRAGELAPGYTFKTPPGGGAASVQLTASMMGAVPGGSDFSGAKWASPVVFMPDGTSIDYSLQICDQAGRHLTLAVRGLTGEAKVFPLGYGGGTGR